jgi:hypothetical protein
MSATTRRGALQLSVAAIVAGLTVPASASAIAPDTELATLCNQLVVTETELWLLAEHDEHAPDFGPNNARYDQLIDERDRLMELIGDCQSPADQAGIVAMARAAMTWTERDHEGNVVCQDFGDEMMVKLAEGVAAGFVWPPRPGDCSTVHWAPATSAREIAEHRAAYEAQMASAKAEIQAKQEAEKAERDRLEASSLLTDTDDELRNQIKISRKIRARAEQIHSELAGEMARRGLEAA